MDGWTVHFFLLRLFFRLPGRGGAGTAGGSSDRTSTTAGGVRKDRGAGGANREGGGAGKGKGPVRVLMEGRGGGGVSS